MTSVDQKSPKLNQTDQVESNKDAETDQGNDRTVEPQKKKRKSSKTKSKSPTKMRKRKDTPFPDKPKEAEAVAEKPAAAAKKPAKVKMINYFHLFKFSSRGDKCLLGIGMAMGLISGCLMPSVAIVMGKVVAIFDPRLGTEKMYEEIINMLKFVAVFGSLLWFCGYFSYAFLAHQAEKLSFQLRSRYLSELMKQEPGYFEKRNATAIPSEIATLFQQLTEGCGEKVSQFLFNMGQALASFALALYLGRGFAGLCLCYMPVIVGMFMFTAKTMARVQTAKIMEMIRLGGVTQEIFDALKLVLSFANEDMAIEMYRKQAVKTSQAQLHAAKWSACISGSFFTIMFGFNLWANWLASLIISEKWIDSRTGNVYIIEDIIAVTQCTMMAMFTAGMLMPILPGIIKGLVAGQKIFDVIERTPAIASGPNSDVTFKKKINFNDIHFRYPTQPEEASDIFSGASFSIKAGTSTAIVGPSGSGKSTIVQLINRFYDPTQGSVSFDDNNLKEMNLVNLRENIGYVSQEPVLIIGTIRDNLLFGKHDATEDEIWKALKKANADFVRDELPEKLDTQVGFGSILNLSGGQKQRIAIARALIKKPKILILDEATSALDPKSEKEVQDAIDKIAREQGGKLTIVMIAHRLQTIQTAENLLHMQNSHTVKAAKKGTPEYEKILETLRKTSYAHQVNSDEGALTGVVNPTKKEKEVQTLTGVVSPPKKKKSIKKALKEQEIFVPALVEAEGKELGNSWRRLAKYYKPKCIMFGMMCASIINSFSWPLMGWLNTNIMFSLMEMTYDVEAGRQDLYFYLWIFGFFCIGVGLLTSMTSCMYGVGGENLTCEVRNELIKGIIYKQYCWFDNEQHAPGVLTNVINEDVMALNGMTTETLATATTAILGLSVGFALSAYFSWQMALCTVASSPIMLLGVYGMNRLQWGNKKGGSQGRNQLAVTDDYSKANGLLSELITNYKTVISLGQPNIQFIVQKFENYLEGPQDERISNQHIAGVLFGYSQASRMAFLGFIFWLGQHLIINYGLEKQGVFMAIWILYTASYGVGSSFSNIPNIKKAQISGQEIFKIIDEYSTLDVRTSHPSQTTEIKKGAIEFNQVEFQYPNGKKPILKSLNLSIPANAKIALVGSSGCGKSTITNLILRFYELQKGNITIDGVDLRNYNVKNLRRQIGFVMQEPLLFNQTIKENILYGKVDASDAEVLRVAELSNSLNFIQNERDVEKMSKDDRIALLNDQLKEQMTKLKAGNSNIAAIDISRIHELNRLELLLKVLQMADESALTLINRDTKKFIRQMKADLKQIAGLRWDDLIIRLEWKHAEKSILKLASSLSEEQAKELHEGLASMPYKFSVKTVKKWMKQTSLSLAQQVSADGHLLAEAVASRLNQLTTGFVERMEKESGKGLVLSKGFDKMCGLKGGKMSGGQKQRIAIARALIRDPKILILDEATSALDEQSQEVVQQALDRAMEGRTSIVIAHRLSTIRNCQILFVVNDGKIVEQGSYDELSADQSSYFYKLKQGMEN